MKEYFLLKIVIVFVLILGLIEILFRLFWRIFKGKNYVMRPKINYTNLYLEPLPYLPYSYRKNAFIKQVDYDRNELHKDKKYKFYGVHTNLLRITNGPKGDRPVAIPKPEGLIRINCLGASTTNSYINFNGQLYSYPLELEKLLKVQYPSQSIEVNNFGHGGWNSADIMVNFMMTVYDTSPDIIVIYHAYNDLPVSLAPNFSSDYSHYKRNFAYLYPEYKRISRYPDLPFALYNFLLSKTHSRVMEIGNNIGVCTSVGGYDLSSPFEGLKTYERNLEHIIKVCKASGIAVVLSTYVFNRPSNFENNAISKKLAEGIKKENEVLRNLAIKYQTGFVDNEQDFPKNWDYFVDSVHFTQDGMRLLAQSLVNPIKQFIDGRIKKGLGSHNETK